MVQFFSSCDCTTLGGTISLAWRAQLIVGIPTFGNINFSQGRPTVALIDVIYFNGTWNVTDSVGRNARVSLLLSSQMFVKRIIGRCGRKRGTGQQVLHTAIAKDYNYQNLVKYIAANRTSVCANRRGILKLVTQPSSTMTRPDEARFRDALTYDRRQQVSRSETPKSVVIRPARRETISTIAAAWCRRIAVKSFLFLSLIDLLFF